MDGEYICDCGKAYGSYAAFCMHQKNKHNNQNTSDNERSSQGKVKRGRVSCDLKKCSFASFTQPVGFEALGIIELGLLELENKYKGKIIGHPTAIIQYQPPVTIIKEIQDQKSLLLEGFISFIKQFTNHMTRTAACTTITFLHKLIQYGINQNNLQTIHLYNQYFKCHLDEIRSYPLGVEFYMNVCVIMSKWLKVLGYTSESLKVRQNNRKQTCALG